MTVISPPTSEPRLKRPGWTRLVDLILRTAHVLAIGAMFGGAVFRIPWEQFQPWRSFAIATGFALIISEIIHHRNWIFQGRGILVCVHTGIFILVNFRPDLAIPCLIASAVLGMVGSHMPKKFRYWSFMRGKGVEEENAP